MRVPGLLFVLALVLNPLAIRADDVSPTPRNEVVSGKTDDFNPDAIGNPSLKLMMLGDSLSVPFHYVGAGKIKDMIFNQRVGGWFYDDKADAPRSLYEQIALDKKIPVQAINVSIAGSWIKEPDSLFISSRIYGMDSLDRQVSRVLLEKKFPNWVGVWNGHNDADWRYAAQLQGVRAEKLEAFRREWPGKVTANLKAQLKRLVDKARLVSYPVTIMVFGLLDAASELETRAFAIKAHAENKDVFPQLPNAIRGFPSLQPEFEKQTLETFQSIAIQWREMVDDLNFGLENDPKPTQVIYSNAFSKIKMTKDAVDPVDALHPRNPETHQALANAAMDEFERRDIFDYLLLNRN